MARVNCPKCKLAFSSKDDRTAQCPDCGTRFPLGSTKPAGRSGQSSNSDRATPPPGKKSGLALILVLLVMVTVVVLGGAGFGVWYFVFKKKDKAAPEPEVAKDEPNRVGLAPNTELRKEDIYTRLLPATVFITTSDGSIGSGVLVARDPHLVLTNHHVVGSHLTVTVYFPDMATGQANTEMNHYFRNAPTLGIRGRVLERNPGKDVAVVQLDRVPDNAPAIPLALKSAPPLANVVGIGASGAQRNALWQPHSGDVRQIAQTPSITGTLCWFLFTQQPTNPGDSGGPIVNNRVELVAIVQGGPRRLVKTLKSKDGLIIRDNRGQPIQEVTGDDNVAYNIELRELREFLAFTYQAHFGAEFPTPPSIIGTISETPTTNEKNYTANDYVQILRDNSDAEARIAVRRLTQLGHPSVAPLVDFLNDVTVVRRHHYALEALEKIGPPTADPAIEPARKALKSEEPNAKLAAVKFLGAMGNAARQANVVPDIFQAVSGENNPALRAAAEQAILRLGPYGEKDVEAIVGKKPDTDPYVRGLRAKLIVEMDLSPAEKVKRLDRFFKDDEVHVRAEAIRAVGKPERLAREDIYRLVLPFLGDKDRIIRTAALESLYKIPRTDVADLDTLRPFFKSDSSETHSFLLSRVATLGDKAVPIVPELVQSLAFADDQIKGEALATALAIGRNLTPLKDELIKLTRHKERPDFRVDAMRGLAIIGKDEPGVLQAIFDRLDDPDVLKKRNRSALELRLGLVEEFVKEKLRYMLDLPPYDPGSPPVWCYAVELLHTMLPVKDEVQVNDIKHLLNPDKTRPILPRAMAAKAVMESGSAAKVAISDITKALADPDLHDLIVRRNLCKAAGNCGVQGSPATEQLARMATYQLTEDEARKIGVIANQLHKELRDTAIAALKQVGSGAKSAVPALREVLKSNSANASMITDTIETLGSIGESAAPAVPELINLFKTEKDHSTIIDGTAPRAKLVVEAVKKIGPTAASPIIEYLRKYERDFLDGRPNYGAEVTKFAGCLECLLALNPPVVVKDKETMIKELKFLRSQSDLRKYNLISRRLTDAITQLEAKK